MIRNISFASLLLLGQVAFGQDGQPAESDGQDEVALAATDLLPQSDSDRLFRTDRPKFTRTSSTVGEYFTQYESGVTYRYDLILARHLNQFELPEFLVRHGVSENVEVRVGWDGYVHSNNLNRLGPGFGTDEGFRDVEFGFKAKMTRQQYFFPETAILGQLSVPTGGIFSNRSAFPGFEFLYSWDLFYGFEFGGGTGLRGRRDRRDSFTQFEQSLYLQREFLCGVGVFMEWYTLAFDNAASELPLHFMQYGLTYLLRPNCQLDWRIGYGLNGRSDDLVTGFGIVIRR